MLSESAVESKSKKKNYRLTMVLVALILVSGTYLFDILYSSSRANPVKTIPVDTSQNNYPINQPTYTLEQVAERNSKSACWTIIKSSIYDITFYIPYHPGGEEEILQICGRDGSQLFAKTREYQGDDVSTFNGKLYRGKLAQ
jgi:cytochrome b involved in lipid metabolism